MTEPFRLKKLKMDSLPSIDVASPKARQILAGAKQAFLELGFEGTSVEEIARRAGVSKGTLYNYFPDKRALFAAVVREECEEQTQRIMQIEGSEEAAAVVLRRVARSLVAFLLSPFAQGIFRMAVAESQRFPDLGVAFYSSGPQLGSQRLSHYLAGAVARGELAIEDTDLAAHQFVELCRADLFYKRLLGMKTDVTEAEMERVAEGAVATFLQAFGRKEV